MGKLEKCHKELVSILQFCSFLSFQAMFCVLLSPLIVPLLLIQCLSLWTYRLTHVEVVFKMPLTPHPSTISYPILHTYMDLVLISGFPSCLEVKSTYLYLFFFIFPKSLKKATLYRNLCLFGFPPSGISHYSNSFLLTQDFSKCDPLTGIWIINSLEILLHLKLWGWLF